MSKIICDVCGTAYPETASQCPICGCVRPANANTVSSETGASGQSGTGTYTYVKGGRFSKSNVRRRVQAAPAAAAKPSTAQRTEHKRSSGGSSGKNQSSDRGLVVIVVILLLAIIGVAIYIFARYFLPSDLGSTVKPNETGKSTQSTQDPYDTQGGGYQPQDIPCTALTVTPESFTMQSAGEGLLLNVKTEPADTTDDVSYTSSDPSVATVSATGNVTAVGPGEAVITVTCGSQSQTCTVTCDFESTDPSGETTEPTGTQPPAEVLKLNREDFTLGYQGEEWMLYSGNIPVDQITWTSDDESLVTIHNGRVVAVSGPGTTKVHAEYNGVKVSCIVRCSFTAPNPGLPGNGGGVGEDKPNQCKINYTDVTFYIGKPGGNDVTLQLRDSKGTLLEVDWIAENDEIVTIVGNSIQGKSPGTTTVYTIYNGQRYSCLFRVHNYNP